MTTEKTCRYGHGPLNRESGSWALAMVHVTPPVEGGDQGSLINGNAVWTCTILVCSHCGYVELEDTGALNGEENGPSV